MAEARLRSSLKATFRIKETSNYSYHVSTVCINFNSIRLPSQHMY